MGVVVFVVVVAVGVYFREAMVFLKTGVDFGDCDVEGWGVWVVVVFGEGEG